MTEGDSTIKPILPAAGYAPEPSAISRDRDTNGTAIVRARRRKKQKKKKPVPPPDTVDSPDDSEPEHRVDIRAEAFRIETPIRVDPARLATLTRPIPGRTRQGAHGLGTTIAITRIVLMRSPVSKTQDHGREEARP